MRELIDEASQAASLCKFPEPGWLAKADAMLEKCTRPSTSIAVALAVCNKP